MEKKNEKNSKNLKKSVKVEKNHKKIRNIVYKSPLCVIFNHSTCVRNSFLILLYRVCGKHIVLTSFSVGSCYEMLAARCNKNRLDLLKFFCSFSMWIAWKEKRKKGEKKLNNLKCLKKIEKNW